MIASKHYSKLTAIVMLLAIMLTVFFMVRPNEADKVTSQPSNEADYVSSLFSENSILSIAIKADVDEWQSMLDNAQNETYIPCDVTINGTTFYSVGIRPKGNSSLTQVANSESDRYSFKLEFDHYIKGQTCFGLDKLVVNNIQADNSYMKEYLSYDLMRFMDIDAPLTAYADITVNGKAWGFYLAIEALDNSYMERAFGTDSGQLYNVKSMEAGGGFGNADKKIPTGGRAPGASGGDLVYTNDAADSYGAIFNNAVFDATQTDQARVIFALKNLSTGTQLETSFDVDEILRYFAAHTTLVNLDSYVSNMKQNYYLYENEGVLSILPWDYNLAFGGFNARSASEVVNFPIDTPVSGVELSERPLLAKLLENDTYKAKYHQYLQEIVDGYLNSGVFVQKVEKLDTLISDSVKNDASAFCTYEQYREALPVLTQFALLRAKSIQGQLDGTIPSTTAGQTSDASMLVDASALDLSALGSQGGGGMGGRVGMGQPPTANNPNQMGKPPIGGDNRGKGDMQRPGPQGGFQPNGQAGFQPQNGQDGGFSPPQGNVPEQAVPKVNPTTQTAFRTTDLLLFVLSAAALMGGLVFVIGFQRKKKLPRLKSEKQTTGSKKRIDLRVCLIIGVLLAIGAWTLWRYVIPKSETIYGLEGSTTRSEKQTGTNAKANSTAQVSDTAYKSVDLSVEIKTVSKQDLLYYVADVKLSDMSLLKSAFAQDKFGQNISEEAISLASRNNAILAINGDYYGWRDDGIIIRNSKVYRNKPVRQMLALYDNGTMKTLNEKDYDTDEKIKALLDEGVTQTFSFGPALIKDGERRTDLIDAQSYLNQKHPRTAIGMIEPYHFVFVIVEGRISESKGVDLFCLTDILEDLGCVEAYNLDGGASSALVFNGKKLNKLETRNLSDMIYLTNR